MIPRSRETIVVAGVKFTPLACDYDWGNGPFRLRFNPWRESKRWPSHVGWRATVTEGDFADGSSPEQALSMLLAKIIEKRKQELSDLESMRMKVEHGSDCSQVVSQQAADLILARLKGLRKEHVETFWSMLIPKNVSEFREGSVPAIMRMISILEEIQLGERVIDAE